MYRRSFLKTSLCGTLGFATPLRFPTESSHILTLSFDDGFKQSFYKIADLYEAHGLSACFNVIASGHLTSFKAVDEWILPELMGDFEDWNALKSRGHEVMPHSWKHLNLARQSEKKARKLIDKCLDYFEEHLEGYTNEGAVFNFPFNSSTPELDAYLLTRVKAVRTFTQETYNPFPSSETPLVLACRSKGPSNIDTWVDEQVNSFLDSKGGWLILNLHGLDGEGWGPISSAYLKKLLKRLEGRDGLALMPTGEVLKQYA